MTVNQFRTSIFTKWGSKVVSWRQKGIRCDNWVRAVVYHIKYITLFAKEVKMHWVDQEASFLRQVVFSTDLTTTNVL